MNLIDYNQAVEALEKERQLLLNREQYGAENVLVHHALNVIAELPVIRQPQIVRCGDCKHGEKTSTFRHYPNLTWCNKCLQTHGDDWFCADGERRTDEEGL